MKRNGPHHLTAVLLLTGMLGGLLGGCATQQTTFTDGERDPWEGYNRKVHAFNNSLDRAVFRPVAKGYDVVMPDGPQRGVRNFFRNQIAPRVEAEGIDKVTADILAGNLRIEEEGSGEQNAAQDQP